MWVKHYNNITLAVVTVSRPGIGPDHLVDMPGMSELTARQKYRRRALTEGSYFMPN